MHLCTRGITSKLVNTERVLEELKYKRYIDNGSFQLRVSNSYLPSKVWSLIEQGIKLILSNKNRPL